MTTTTHHRGFRPAAALVLLVAGAGVAAAIWVSGAHGWSLATVGVYAVLAVGAS